MVIRKPTLGLKPILLERIWETTLAYSLLSEIKKKKNKKNKKKKKKKKKKTRNDITPALPYCRQITVKNRQNLQINNPKADVHKINAHSKFGENPLLFNQAIVRKRKKKLTFRGQITQTKIDEICPLAIQNQISTILIYS